VQTKGSLTYNLNKYSIERSLSPLIQSRFEYLMEKDPSQNPNEILDYSILWAFQFQRHWLHYKIPKWFGVFNSIQKFVCEKHGLSPGEYTYFANKVENDFVQENLALLLEYGVPLSAIQKIEDKVNPELLDEEVLRLISELDLDSIENLIPYEKEKIQKNI